MIRINAERGLIGDEEQDAGIRKRLDHLRGGSPTATNAAGWTDKVIEIQGNPMPGGGYVTTFSDITHFKEIESELQLINETLEQRVQQRTRNSAKQLHDVEDARQSR